MQVRAMNNLLQHVFVRALVGNVAKKFATKNNQTIRNNKYYINININHDKERKKKRKVGGRHHIHMGQIPSERVKSINLNMKIFWNLIRVRGIIFLHTHRLKHAQHTHSPRRSVFQLVHLHFNASINSI